MSKHRRKYEDVPPFPRFSTSPPQNVCLQTPGITSRKVRGGELQAPTTLEVKVEEWIEAKNQGPAHHQPSFGAFTPTPVRKTASNSSRLPQLPGWRPIVTGVTTSRSEKQPYLRRPFPEEEKESAFEFKDAIDRADRRLRPV